MASKLEIFNTALRYCREQSIASLTEDRKPRHLLDDVWDSGGLDRCLEQANWKFATRTQKLDYDTSIEPEFGYSRAFQVPSDWVVTSGVCADEYFDVPLTRYAHEAGYWYADIEIIYVKFVSNHVDYGNNIGDWPRTFADFVAAHFANEIVDRLTSDQATIDSVEKRLEKNRLDSMNKDAKNQPQQFPAPGNWVSSRGRSSGGNRDRGNRHSLLG